MREQRGSKGEQRGSKRERFGAVQGRSRWEPEMAIEDDSNLPLARA